MSQRNHSRNHSSSSRTAEASKPATPTVGSSQQPEYYIAHLDTTFQKVFEKMQPLQEQKTSLAATTSDKAETKDDDIDDIVVDDDDWVVVMNAEGLRGKTFTGYQGWFLPYGCNDSGDPGLNWMHYGAAAKAAAAAGQTAQKLRPREGRTFQPGTAVIDYWHSETDLGPTEKYPTPFLQTTPANRPDDGSNNNSNNVAYAISSLHPDTVDRHFRWMHDYGIDGAFAQRFGASLRTPTMYDCRTMVLDNIRKAARNHGRSYAVMYDLSGLQAGEIRSVVMQDWKRLRNRMKLGEEENYMTLHGKPLVAIWGIGFNDGRAYSLEECAELIRFLKNNPEFGGCSVMVGIPFYWREGNRDSIPNESLFPILKMADVISPWAVGRYRTMEEASAMARVYKDDMEWCCERGIEYLPVAFPGFSWGNMSKTLGNDPIYDQIPRLQGEFLWSQAKTVAEAGIHTIYLAMFDEVDEGTCMLKVSQNPPVGASHFLHYEGLEEDHYLWLAGRVRDLLQGKLSTKSPIPRRGKGTAG